MCFLFPDPIVRAAQTPKLFRLLYDSDRSAGITFVTSGGEAATLWRRPGHSHVPAFEMIRNGIPLLATFGTAVGRALRLSTAIDAHHPARELWYLHIAGCDPAHQGKGHGRRAIAAGIAHAGMTPVYLETGTAKNVAFYRSLGFVVTQEWSVKDGPKFWSMLREPTPQPPWG